MAEATRPAPGGAAPALAALMLPVRFVAGKTVVQSTVRGLSAGGVSVTAAVCPPTGTRISLALYLTDGAPPEVAVGTVAESDPLGPGGFWADFLVLDSLARQRITALVAGSEGACARPLPLPAAFPPPLGRARLDRLFVRHPARVKVRIGKGRSASEEVTGNMSLGGLFLETLEPPPLGQALELHLHLPDGGEPAPTTALVAHRIPPSDAARRGIPPGAGLQFLGAPGAFHERIGRFLGSLATA